MEINFNKAFLKSIIFKTLFISSIIIFIGTNIFLVTSCRKPFFQNKVIPITVEQVKKIIDRNEDYLILDVRTEDEYNEGHLVSAILIPVDELEERLNELPKNKPIIVYCRSGRRSSKAADILLKNKFSPIYEMTGGIELWKKNGYPLEGQ